MKRERVYRQPNYIYKAYIMEKYPNLSKEVSQATMLNYSLNKLETEGVFNYFLLHFKDVKKLSELKQEYDCIDKGLINEVLNINHAYFERVKRLKKRVSKILLNNENVVFLTLTFNENKLLNSTPEVRRKKVSLFLKEIGSCYVANVDYGSNTHREHYHAVVALKTYIDPKNNFRTNNYGFLSIEKIKNKNIEALSKYISKLTNHAIKKSCERVALIYSR